ncbi:MAG TPA: alpha/beta hydrolase [Planctomycetota bacterium]|nr:alpha/beta hydrolase [Planctomycetota bacterium]
MKPSWVGLLSIVGGCATALEPEHRLTGFREELFQEGWLRDLSLDGRRYCVLEAGSGPPLVLLHGLGGSIYDWRYLIRPLAESHRLIVPDLLGAGESDLPEGEDYSIAAQARRIRGILDRLGVGRATFIGNSYGGGIALRLAQDWPERVERLVLLNSVCYPDHIPTYVYLARAPWAGCVAETVPLTKATRWVLGNNDRTISILSDAELETYNQELRTPGRRRAMIEVLRALVPPDSTEFEARLKTIEAPTLLIWGAADTTVPVAMGRRLLGDLPKAQLVELDAGHVPNQECPAEVLRLIEDFLR